MQDTFRLNDRIYHMVHFDNLENIFARRTLLSKHALEQEGIKLRSIALDSVQKLRERIFIWDALINRFRPLHSFVPFYFAKRTPMLYVQYARGLQHDIIFLEVSSRILKEPGVIFTDGNATNQQLSDQNDQKVYIIPASLSKEQERYYSLGNIPLGTNFNRSTFFAHWKLLRHLNWEVIYSESRFDGNAEKKRIKHAEILVPDRLPLERLVGISAMSMWQVEKVNDLAKRCGLEGCIPRAVSKPDLYFP
jgi:hypothetical protein